MGKIGNKEEQTIITSVSKDSNRKILRGFGFLLFLLGAIFIISSFFGVQIITGNVVSGEENTKSISSVIGLILEAAGIILMIVMKNESKIRQIN